MIETKTDFKRLEQSLSDRNLISSNRETTVQAGEHMQRYVPRKFGPLRQSRRTVDHETIEWRGVPYAAIQYATQFQNYTTPGTGPNWDRVASGNHMREWEQTYLRGLGL